MLYRFVFTMYYVIYVVNKNIFIYIYIYYLYLSMKCILYIVYTLYITIDLGWQPVILIFVVIIILFINLRMVYSILFYYY